MKSHQAILILLHLNVHVITCPFFLLCFLSAMIYEKEETCKGRMIVSSSKIYNILLPSSIPCSIRLKSCKTHSRYNQLFFSLINSAVPCNRKLKQVSADLAYTSWGRNLSGNYGFASPVLSPVVCIRSRYFCHRLLHTAVLSMPAFIGNPSSSAEFK